MSWVRIWIHLVFTTKDKEHFLNKEIRYDVQRHIIANCKDKNIMLQAINGYTEHLHCLVSLGKDESIARIAQLIKGESSFWINGNKIIAERFAWQDDYFAVSVSESQVGSVIKYIRNQENHHKKKSYMEEVEEIVEKYGFHIVKDGKDSCRVKQKPVWPLVKTNGKQ